MKPIFRADFDFSSERDRIKHCAGYVICENVQLRSDKVYSFDVRDIVIKKLIAKNPDFDIVGNLAIKNCKLFDNEYFSL